MGIGRETVPRGTLPPEALQLLLAQATLQEGPGVDPGRGMPLEEHRVSAPLGLRAAEEVVEAHLEEGRAGGVG